MNAAQGAILGVAATVALFMVWKAVDSRLNYLERAPRSNSLVPPSVDVRDMQKEHARMFAEDLREQGLVVTEAS